MVVRDVVLSVRRIVVEIQQLFFFFFKTRVGEAGRWPWISCDTCAMSGRNA